MEIIKVKVDNTSNIGKNSKVVKLYRRTQKDLNRIYGEEVPEITLLDQWSYKPYRATAHYNESMLIGLIIGDTDKVDRFCKDATQEQLEKNWKVGYDNRRGAFDNYKTNQVLILSISQGAGNGLREDLYNLHYQLMDSLNYTYYDSEESSVDLVYDVGRAWAMWYLQIGLITQRLKDLGENGRKVLETYQADYTAFYFKADSDSYFDGISLEGEYMNLNSEEDAKYCECCSFKEYGERHDMVYCEDEGGYICDNCQDDYSYCRACDEYFNRDNLIWNERTEEDFCENCYEEPNAIRSYDYTPYLVFWDYSNKFRSVNDQLRSNKKYKVPFYGIELEVECRDSDKYSYAENITNYKGNEQFFYCKNDGSLNDGFEICFMPMTFNALKHLDLEESIFKYRGREALQSYATRTCGIHIHINREAFSDHHLFKFITFIHEYKGLAYLISQRKEVGELNQYSKFNNSFKDRAKKKMVDNIKNKRREYKEYKNKSQNHSTTRYGEKYVPVNLQHSNTIEVRIFKGNLVEESFRKNIEFIDSLYYFTRVTAMKDLTVRDYISFIEKDFKRYKNLNSFLGKNNKRIKRVLEFPLEVPEGLNY
mgnify:CR=1 FL=1|tara:strand:+ start:2218 stop:3999 length:1782 start_codon:yes stop_codon:yes gene_type:complete